MTLIVALFRLIFNVKIAVSIQSVKKNNKIGESILLMRSITTNEFRKLLKPPVNKSFRIRELAMVLENNIKDQFAREKIL